MARRLLLLNGVAILCVILFHATGFGFTAMFAWAHRYRHVASPNYDAMGSAAYYGLRVIEQLVVFSIPAFLFVSGFFVAVLTGRTRSTPDSKAIGARVRHLLVPYAFWSAVVLAAFALQGKVFSESQYLRLFLTGASNPSYYYVPLLIQLYVLAPVIVLLARWNWKALLAATAALQVVVYLLQYLLILSPELPVARAIATMLPKWLFVVHLFWFTFGVVAGFQLPAMRPIIDRHRWLWLGAAATLLVVGVVEWELLLHWSGRPWIENRATFIDGLYAACMILSFIAFADVRVPLSEALQTLGAQSYGIYLVHGLAMEFLARGLYHVAPLVLGRQLLLQPLLIGLGLATPLALMAVARRSSRGFYSYLFG
jgi:peptidoglycan/LPS O-acetylase OafA/YrhL